MRFGSVDCDGADEGARYFGIPEGNARRLDATFDCPNAHAPCSNHEFSLGRSTL